MNKQKKYRDKHPEKVREWNRRCHLKQRYGITIEEYNEMLESQGGGCALCGSVAKTKSLHVDHCHETGRIRGILCFPCNKAIAKLGDNEAGLRRAIAYLRKTDESFDSWGA